MQKEWKTNASDMAVDKSGGNGTSTKHLYNLKPYAALYFT